MSNAVPRTCYPAPPGPVGPVNVELSPGTDEKDGELGVGDVLGMVKRSFATVRAALTQQRGNVDDIVGDRNHAQCTVYKNFALAMHSLTLRSSAG